ncbi:MAG: 5'-methylthioadenosine/adenosylhomocysteine nucleosidase [Phycisphaerae bacterium]|jgi:adenosylhomocysteine nucleosidase
MSFGIMCAIPQEASRLAGALAREHEHVHGGRTYYTGTLPGAGTSERVVLVYSRVGKVAAAATAQHLIDVHRVKAILFTGVAGALAPDLRVGDIVVAKNLWQHDMDASPIFPPLEIPLLGVTSIAADEAISVRLRHGAELFAREDFERDVPPHVRQALHLPTPRVVAGDIASGDRFVSTDAERAALRERVPSAICVEMEGAAVAQVCHEQGVPLAVVRVISDSANDHAARDFGTFIADAASVYGLGIVRRALAV